MWKGSEDMLSIKDVSEESGYSQKTIRRHIAAKKLLAKKVNSKYLIEKSEYERWIRSDLKIDEEGVFFLTEKSRNDDVNWIDVTSNWLECGWTESNYENGLSFVDLFSGAGGLSCGLVMAGYSPVASVEVMKEAVETYRYNFCDKKRFKEKLINNDIRINDTKIELYNYVNENVDNLDLIVGGFPCQGFSMSGNRVVADERNSLYLDMLEIVDELKPSYVVMENVEGIRSMLNGNIEAKIIEDYRNIGYEINVTVLNSADYYVPQVRKRVIFIGNRIGGKNYHPMPILNKNEYVTLGECIKKFMKLPEDKTKNHIFTRHSKEMQDKISNTKEGESLYKNYSDAWKKSPWDKPSCTVKENHGGVNLHPKLPRVLTPRELASLQSFPEDFIFKGTKKWQLVQIGNAVPPLLGKAIGIAVMKAIVESKESTDNIK